MPDDEALITRRRVTAKFFAGLFINSEHFTTNMSYSDAYYSCSYLLPEYSSNHVRSSACDPDDGDVWSDWPV